MPSESDGIAGQMRIRRRACGGASCKAEETAGIDQAANTVPGYDGWTQRVCQGDVSYVMCQADGSRRGRVGTDRAGGIDQQRVKFARVLAPHETRQNIVG